MHGLELPVISVGMGEQEAVYHLLGVWSMPRLVVSFMSGYKEAIPVWPVSTKSQ